MAHPEQVLLRDPHRYIAHPHMTRLAGGAWLLVATCGPRRAATLHPPHDPEFITVAIRSDDEGMNWSAHAPVPAYGNTGTECSGLTALPDGDVLLNQWRFRWYSECDSPGETVSTAAELRADRLASTELDGDDAARLITWMRGGGSTIIWRGTCAGRHWGDPVTLDTARFSGGYGLRGGVVFPDGEIVLPLCDVPQYRRVFLVRSHDAGRSWTPPEMVATADEPEFEEPAPFAFADGRMLLLLRENTSRQLYAQHSGDRGAHWSQPARAGLEGYPAHIVDLGGGRLAAVTGARDRGAICLTASRDDGRSWDRTGAIDVAADLGTRDLGYPTAVVDSDGAVFVAYYRRDREGVTGLYGRRIELQER